MLKICDLVIMRIINSNFCIKMMFKDIYMNYDIIYIIDVRMKNKFLLFMLFSMFYERKIFFYFF